MHPLYLAAVLLLSAFIPPTLGQGYGSAPAKGKKHRTTTTTTLPPDIAGLNFGPGFQPGYNPISSTPVPDNSLGSYNPPPQGGSGSYWWQKPDSPFIGATAPAPSPSPQPGHPGSQPGYPGAQPGQPGYPGAQPGQPGYPGVQPGYPGTQPGQPGGCGSGGAGGCGGVSPGGGAQPPVNIQGNPFLSGLKPGSGSQQPPIRPTGQTVTCSGAGYVCAPKHLCSNGVVTQDGQGIFQVRSETQYCDASTQVCCRLQQQGNTPSGGCGGYGQGGGCGGVQPAPGAPQPSPFPSQPPFSGNNNAGPGLVHIPPSPGPSHPNGGQYPSGNNNAGPGLVHIPPSPGPSHPNGGQYPSASIPSPTYSPTGNNVGRPVPGTNGVPIGGSIYDTTGRPVTQAPGQNPYTGPLNTTPHPGCAAALKCVQESYCTAEGVMADRPVSLTREQYENRVPLSDCADPDTGVLGKCCRDPNYKDPWPGGMMMKNNGDGTGGGQQLPQHQFHPQPQGNECGPSASCQPTYQCGNQYRVQPLRNCRVPLDGSSGVCCSSTQPGDAVFPGSTPIPQKPQKKPISGYPQPKPSAQPFPQKPSSQPFPQTNPSQQPFPQTSPSHQPFPQTSPSQQPFPQTSPSQNPFPHTSPSQQPFPQTSPSQQPFPQTSPSQKPFPNTGPSQQPFPQTGPSKQPFPQTSPSQQPYPQTSPSQKPFLHVSPSQQQFPETSPSQQPYPHTSPSQQPYPQTSPSQQPFPHTGPSQKPFPQTNPSQQPFPHTSPSQKPFPQTSPSQQPFPHTSPSQQPFPQPSPSQQPFPQPSPSQQPFPQTSPFPHTSPSQQPFPQPSPSQQPFPQPSPSQQPFPHTSPSQQTFPQTSPSQQPSPHKPGAQPFPQNLPSSQPSAQPFPQSKPFPQQKPGTQPFPTALPTQPVPNIEPSPYPRPGAQHKPQTQPFPSPNQPQPQFPGVLQPGPSGQVSPKPGAECGIRRQVPRQGLADTDAGFSEFPWQALVLTSSQKPLCSAAIISDRAVVTAAHCIQDVESSDLLVQAGVWKLNSNNQPKPIQTQHVAAIARHPDFEPSSLFNDLAIILLAAPLKFDDHVDKICLPQRGQDVTHLQRCIATGWGKPAIQGNVPGSILHQIPVTLIPQTSCEEKLRQTHLGRYFKLNPSFQCAIPAGPSQDLCKVDPGGPIACDRGDGHHELSGTYSWDIGCNVPNSPTVFGGIDADWIQSVLARPVDDVARDELNDILKQQQQQELTGVDIDNKPGFSQGYGKK